MLPNCKPSPPAAAGGVWRVCGKAFRDGENRKVFVNGVTYGPFEPVPGRGPWPEEARLRQDFADMARMGFNVVRIYELPTAAVLATATEQGLKLLCGVPWTQHVDFLADADVRADATGRVRAAARELGNMPTVLSLIIGNEIEKTLVRWMGPEKVRAFLEHLIAVAHAEAPGLVVSYATYPSTEYLVPRNADFVGFNVFLERREAFAGYLQRLQNIAGDKPLIITEFGLDTRTHGEAAQREAMQWQRECVLRGGAAGSVWFSFTDEWHRGGEEVTGWEFGLVTRDRDWKAAAYEAASLPKALQKLPMETSPLVSVVVCTRNGAATLRQCLEALSRQSCPRFEVLVIDDGSTDATPEITGSFLEVRYHRQDHAGLSAARNLGLKLARGEVIAYTDDDCLPDENWLSQLVAAYDDPQWVAAGGPNIPPPPRNEVEAVVGAAPGAPTHVLLNDIEAEHLPGCNLSIRRSALEAIGGFREEFRAAGDDVDICWRLQAAGGRLRFVPGAVVWHHRRATVAAYLRQQRGYGNAEALLMGRFASRFAWMGGAQWSGAIYGNGSTDDLRGVEFGRHGLAAFQCIYAREQGGPTRLMSGLSWLTLWVALGCVGLLAGNAALVALAFGLLALSFFAAWRGSARRVSALPQATRSQRLLLWVLCWLQPIVRDAARLKGMIRHRAWPRGKSDWSWSWRREPVLRPQPHWSRCDFWSESSVTRGELLEQLSRLAPDHEMAWRDASEQDVCDAVVRCRGAQFGLLSVTEYHEGSRTLTSVRFGSLPDPKEKEALVALGGALVLAWWLHWPEALGLAMAVMLVAVGFVSWWREVKGCRLVRELLLAAAADCGLALVGSPAANNTEELRRSPLAAMPESAKIILEES